MGPSLRYLVKRTDMPRILPGVIAMALKAMTGEKVAV